jgi:hypothetical protein
MNTQSPKTIGTKYAFDLNRIVQSDEGKELSIEILLFTNHLLKTKGISCMEKLEFSIEDFLKFSKRNKESLFSNAKLFRDLIISSNSRPVEIINDFEYVLIEIANTGFDVNEVFERAGNTRYRFSSQTLLDFTIIVDQDENRIYTIHLNHAFLNSILNEEVFLETEKILSTRNT